MTIIPLFWGFYNDTYAHQVDIVYKQLERSNYYGWLRTEYDAPILTHTFPASVYPEIWSGFVNQSDIFSELDGYLSNGGIPGGTNPLYVIHLAPGVITDSMGTNCASAFADNGWVRNLSHEFQYAIVPDPGTCNLGFDGATRVLSHEIAENVTDPGGDGDGWTAPSEPSSCVSVGAVQIGDLCANEAAQISTPLITSGSIQSNTLTVQKLWSNAVQACVLEDFNPTPPPAPGAGVAAIQQVAGQVDAVAVGPDGTLNLAWEMNNGNWNRFAALSGPNLAVPGAPVTLGHQGSGPTPQTDAFVVDRLGRPNVFYVNNGHPWQGPYIPPGPGMNGSWTTENGRGYLPTNLKIMTDYQVNTNQMDVFYTDIFGIIWFQWVGPDGVWQPPQSLIYTAQAGAPVATAHQGSNQLDLFFVDAAGEIWVMWTNGQSTAGQQTSWARYRLTGANVAVPGSQLAAGLQNGNQVDVFWIDGNGMSQVLWTGPQQWEGPVGIGTGNGVPGGPLAVAYQSGSQLDFFYIDKNGAMNVQWPGPDRWLNYQMSPTGIAPPGAPVAATLQNGAPQLDVVTTGYWGMAIFGTAPNVNWWGPVTVWPPGQ